MSIIFFGSRARIHAKNLHPSKVAQLPNFLLTGTDFTSAFKEIRNIMALADDDQIPVIIFLTDGQDTIKESEKIISNIYNDYSKKPYPMIFKVVGYTQCCHERELIQLTKAGNGGSITRNIGDKAYKMFYKCENQ